MQLGRLSEDVLAPSQESTVLLRFLLREYDANAELVIAFLEGTMLSTDFDIKS